MLDNRGTKVYPHMGTIVDYVDAFRVRLIMRDAKAELNDTQLLAVLKQFSDGGYKWTHIEKLNEFDGAMGYTKAQGED